MNFLAHVYLSGDSEELIIGNFIADAIKGDYSHYSDGIIKGIKLHRKIDEFTDSHPVVDLSKDRLKPEYGRYSSVIVDIFYDHFLAKDWSKYSSVPLNEYALMIYQLMSDHLENMPPRVHTFLPFMISGNWLVNYANLTGIENTLKGMSRRAKFESGMERSIENLRRDYSLYEAEFNQFFPELQKYVQSLL
ncbi:MAG: ACP phosphodiesterase [Cytophagaceae bacterium]|nr:ACP phosphodiesterase [Cytophagaceae bacterium]